MTGRQLEGKYGIKIADDSFYTMAGTLIKAYKIYSADGCLWENGLRSIKAVEQECKQWGQQLLAIKARKEALV